MINVYYLDPETYDANLYTFLTNVETIVPTVYDDGAGNVTIGMGFELSTSNVLAAVLNVVTGGSVPAGLQSDIASIVNGGFTGSTQADINAVMAEYNASYSNVPTTLSLSSAQTAAIFNDLSYSYETTLDTKLSAALGGAELVSSDERIALFDLNWNTKSGATDLIGPKLLNDLSVGDRAEAWFEIRYNDNLGSLPNTDNEGIYYGLAKARYYQSEMFSLYADRNNVTNQEALNVYQMVEREATKIQAYDLKYSGEISEANTDYSSGLSLLQAGTVETLAQSEEPAYNYLITNYTNHAPTGADPVGLNNIFIDYDSTVGSATTLVGTITGTSSNDLIIGIGGTEQLTGSGGNDIIVLTAPGNATISGEAEGSNTVGGFTIADFSHMSAPLTVDFNGLLDTVSYQGISGSGVVTYNDSLYSVEEVVGSSGPDTFSGGNGSFTETNHLVFDGSNGSDIYTFSPSATNILGLVEIKDSGTSGVNSLLFPSIDKTDTTTKIEATPGPNPGDVNIQISDLASDGVTYVQDLTVRINKNDIDSGNGIQDVIFGTGSGQEIIHAKDFVDYMSTHTYTGYTANDIYNNILAWLQSGGETGGEAYAGGGSPTVDASGNMTGIEFSPDAGSNMRLTNYVYADETDNTPVITHYSVSGGSGAVTTTVTFDTAPKDISFVSGIAESDVHLNYQTAGDTLLVSIPTLGYSFSVANFENGKTISGLGYDSLSIQEAFEADGNTTVSWSGGGIYNVSADHDLGLSLGSVNVTYYVQTMNFADGSTLNLQSGTLLFDGTASNDTLTGLTNRMTILDGEGGNDYLSGGASGAIFNGGTGHDTFVVGGGNNTFIFQPGDSPISAGPENIAMPETIAAGTLNQIVLHDALPSDVTIYTTNISTYYIEDVIQYSASDQIETTLYKPALQMGGENNLQNYIQQIAFDDGTTWDLTQGLHLTAPDNAGYQLIGSSGNDILEGGGGVDTLYSYEGNDTLIGHAGDDIMDAGAGTNSYVFYVGDSSKTGASAGDAINQAVGVGTNSIVLHGVLPSAVTITTFTYSPAGNIAIDYSPTDQIRIGNSGTTIEGGYDDENLGSIIQTIVFDDGTVWDLTGGLHLTYTGYALYGTAHNDILEGSSAGGTLYANAGDDNLIAHGGNTAMYGGTGNDTYEFYVGSAPVASGGGNVVEYAGQGTDTILIHGITPAQAILTEGSSGAFTINYGTSDVIHILGSGLTSSNENAGTLVEQVKFDDGTTWDLTGGLHLTATPAITLYGTAYNDILEGATTGSSSMYGNAGDDDLIAHATNTNMYGGTGNDTYEFSVGNGNTNVSETAGQGTDTILIHGITPAQAILTEGSSGAFTINYGTNDVIHILGSGLTSSNENAGTLVEQVKFDDGTTWDLTGGLHLTATPAITLYGTAYNDILEGATTGSSSMYGNAGDDDLIAHATNTSMYGGTGNDTYEFSVGNGNTNVSETAGQGTDTILIHGITSSQAILTEGSSGAFTINYGTSDVIHILGSGLTSDGTYSNENAGTLVEQVKFDDGTTWDLTSGLHLTATSGNTLYGTAYGDTLESATSGSSNLYGNAGNDTLIAHGGNVGMYGGTGDDTYVFNANEATGSVTYNVYESLSQGNDTVVLHNISESSINTWTDAYGDLFLALSSTAQVEIHGAANTDGSANTSAYVENVQFDDGTIWNLTNGLDITNNGTGRTLYGSDQNDVIHSTTANDSLYGYAGNDLLVAGSGTDYMNGGTGADTFQLTSTAHSQAIADFHTADGDKIDIADLLTAYDPVHDAISDFVQLTTSGSNTILSVDTDGTGTAHSMTAVATLNSVTGLDLNTMITAGELVVHHS